MSQSYSLEEGKVKLTEVKDMGEQAKLLVDLNIEKDSYQAIIDRATAKMAEVQNKLNVIEALK